MDAPNVLCSARSPARSSGVPGCERRASSRALRRAASGMLGRCSTGLLALMPLLRSAPAADALRAGDARSAAGDLGRGAVAAKPRLVRTAACA